MKNSEKAELRMDVIDLSKDGFSKEDAIKKLIEWGYNKSTATRYWEVFSQKNTKEKVQ